MPRRSKQSYSDKQQRMVSKLEQSAKLKGRTTKTAQRIAGATGNKRTGGGKPRTSK